MINHLKMVGTSNLSIFADELRYVRTQTNDSNERYAKMQKN